MRGGAGTSHRPSRVAFEHRKLYDSAEPDIRLAQLRPIRAAFSTRPARKKADRAGRRPQYEGALRTAAPNRFSARDARLQQRLAQPVEPYRRREPSDGRQRDPPFLWQCQRGNGEELPLRWITVIGELRIALAVVREHVSGGRPPRLGDPPLLFPATGARTNVEADLVLAPGLAAPGLDRGGLAYLKPLVAALEVPARPVGRAPLPFRCESGVNDRLDDETTKDVRDERRAEGRPTGGIGDLLGCGSLRRSHIECSILLVLAAQ